MLTNPNTLGLFEEHLQEVTSRVHEAGGLVYGDGANFNAMLGICKPGTHRHRHHALQPAQDLLHAAWRRRPRRRRRRSVRRSWPRICPGPSSWSGAAESPAYPLEMPERSIGRVKSFHGNFGILVRAYAYIRMLGAAGLRAVAENAVLNANYLHGAGPGRIPRPVRRPPLHARVRGPGAGSRGAADIHALDVSKRLIDYGFHPPDQLLPAHRAGGADDRADGDGEPGDHGQVRGCACSPSRGRRARSPRFSTTRRTPLPCAGWTK